MLSAWKHLHGSISLPHLGRQLMPPPTRMSNVLTAWLGASKIEAQIWLQGIMLPGQVVAIIVDKMTKSSQ